MYCQYIRRAQTLSIYILVFILLILKLGLGRYDQHENVKLIAGYHRALFQLLTSTASKKVATFNFRQDQPCISYLP